MNNLLIEFLQGIVCGATAIGSWELLRKYNQRRGNR